MEADKDGDGKISFEEFCQMVASTVRKASWTSLIVGCCCEYDLGGCMNSVLLNGPEGWNGMCEYQCRTECMPLFIQCCNGSCWTSVFTVWTIA